tara:strand:+ start:978 stop:1157 length:180 start_codon:yes stop_codon:yes gene_type:complete
MYAHIFGNAENSPVEQWRAELIAGSRVSLPNDKDLLKYNVYLVDTDILQEEVYVTPEKM